MKEKIFLLGILSILLSNISLCQSHKYLYYLDPNLQSVSKSKASVLGKGLKEGDLFRLDCYSITGDILYMSFHFTDSTLTELQGPFTSYHRNLKIEKQGFYDKGQEDGTWQQWDSLGRKIDSTFYRQGKPYITVTYNYNKNGGLSYHSIKDSLLDTYQNISYDEFGAISTEVIFKGQKGVYKTYTNTGIQTDSLYTRDEKEAQFPGGDNGWTSYLRKNLDGNVPSDNKAPNGVYNVIVRFIVKKDGSIEDVYAETYFGYGMEKEVIRIIKSGPKWIPAEQYGRKVNAYRRQPVTFVVSGG